VTKLQVPPYYSERMEKDKLKDNIAQSSYDLAVLDAKEILSNTAVSDHTKDVVGRLLEFGMAAIPGRRIYM